MQHKKVLQSIRNAENNMSDIPTRAIYLQKLPLPLTWQMNQSVGVMLFGRWLQINDENGDK